MQGNPMKHMTQKMTFLQPQFFLSTALILTTLLSFNSHGKTGLTEPATPELVAQGKVLYSTHCAACHGEKGDGNGPAGKMMNPKPRGFADPKTIFKNGETPLNIFTTISNGLPGTAMPAYNKLSDIEKSSLSHYVLVLRKGK
jgi:mono/diheme cytochrome c family protein